MQTTRAAHRRLKHGAFQSKRSGELAVEPRERQSSTAAAIGIRSDCRTTCSVVACNSRWSSGTSRTSRGVVMASGSTAITIAARSCSRLSRALAGAEGLVARRFQCSIRTRQRGRFSEAMSFDPPTIKQPASKLRVLHRRRCSPTPWMSRECARCMSRVAACRMPDAAAAAFGECDGAVR